MGFFSQLCEGCGHPALSIYGVNDVNSWMIQCVAITPLGNVLRGVYDGYGRLENDSTVHDAAIGWDNTVWHEACWKRAGRPVEFTGASPSAPDQGYFFEDGAHDMAEPQ